LTDGPATAKLQSGIRDRPEIVMRSFALSLLVSIAAVAPALAGGPVVPAIGSPLPVAAAIGGLALVVRLLRRN
jgi:hypothetical protein